MKAIFAALRKELEENRPAVLVTIVAQAGSSPRGIGAQMLVKTDGTIAGSVGGGEVEQQCRELAAVCLRERSSLCRTFALRQTGANSIGMVCGGDVTASFLFADEHWNALTEKLTAMLAADEMGQLVLYLDGGQPTLLDKNGQICCGALRENGFAQPLPVRSRAVVFGGGHCAQALVPLLKGVGFRVTVMENRAEYASATLFPDAEEVILGDYRDLSAHLTLSATDYAVVMTHGHAFDLDIQLQLLRDPPYYVGVIGSAAKKAFTRQKLREAGISEEIIRSVHTPIGTDIKAVTPQEIAVSITGEMIRERAVLREADGICPQGCPMHEPEDLSNASL